MEVQLRSNEGSLLYFSSAFDAFEYAAADHSVWKISWTDEITKRRVRLVRTTMGDWKFEPMDVIVKGAKEQEG
jgi:hypothetical protein